MNVLSLFGIRVSLEHRVAADSPARPRRRLGRTVLPLVVAVPLAVATAQVGAAASGTTGTVSASVTTATRSITVSPPSFTYGACIIGSGINQTPTGSTLAFPDGLCRFSPAQGPSNEVTITNGAATAHIDASGADFVPLDVGTDWTLCGGAGPLCIGPNGLPGRDQYSEQSVNTVAGAVILLDNNQQCDVSFASGATNDPCLANPSQSATEEFFMTGPTASTDNSGSFSTTLTWSALP
jgi:hypothetical protein